MNATKNLSSNGTLTDTDDEMRILVGLGLTLLSLLIIFGNIVVIRVYNRDKRLHVPKNYFIVSLATADLLVGVFSINPYTIYLVEGYWPLGKVACQIWLTLDHTLITISNLTLLTIAFDRFSSICFPIVYRLKFKSKYIKRSIMVTWIVSWLVWGPAILIYPHVGTQQGLEERECNIHFYQRNVNVTVSVAFFSYFGLMLFLTFLYVAVSMKIATRKLHSLKKNMKSKDVLSPVGIICKGDKSDQQQTRGFTSCNLLKERTCTVDSTDSFTNSVVTINLEIFADKKTITNINGAVDETSPRRRADDVSIDLKELSYYDNTHFQKFSCGNFPKQKVSTLHHINENVNNNKPIKQAPSEIGYQKRALRLILLVSVAFILSWMPYHVTIIVKAACDTAIPEPWWKFCYIAGWMNSLFNPICYAYGNQKFKKGFRRTLFRPYRGESF